MARRRMNRERANHTLSPGALVNEAYLRLVDQKRLDPADRQQFLGVAGLMMRRVLLDHARRANRREQPEIEAPPVTSGGEPALRTTILALHDALPMLERLNERQHRVVCSRIYDNKTVAEVALELDVSERTVKQDYRVAIAWLRAFLIKERS